MDGGAGYYRAEWCKQIPTVSISIFTNKKNLHNTHSERTSDAAQAAQLGQNHTDPTFSKSEIIAGKSTSEPMAVRWHWMIEFQNKKKEDNQKKRNKKKMKKNFPFPIALSRVSALPQTILKRMWIWYCNNIGGGKSIFFSCLLNIDHWLRYDLCAMYISTHPTIIQKSLRCNPIP